MRILLVGGFAQDSLYSMQGYEGRLLSGLREKGIEAEIIGPVPKVSVIARGSAAKYLAYIDKFVVFKQELIRRSREFDLVHITDQGYAMYAPWVKGRPVVLTVHDLLAVRAALGELDWWKVGPSGQRLQNWILESLKSADVLPCVSDATAKDLRRLTGISAQNSPVVDNGFFKDLSGARRSPERFLHHIGGNQPYKNRLGLVRIVEELLCKAEFKDWGFMMMGKRPTPEILNAVNSSPVAEQIEILVTPSNEVVQKVTSQSSGLIFPSMAEGFGLPILEAMSAGCPVFCSNREPMTYVGGEAAAYFDPLNPARAADAIASRLSSPVNSRVLADNVARFSAERTIDQIIGIYEDALTRRAA